MRVVGEVRAFYERPLPPEARVVVVAGRRAQDVALASAGDSGTASRYSWSSNVR
jgi:hypothetical protein